MIDILRTLGCLLAAGLLAGCSSGDGSSDQPPADPAFLFRSTTDFEFEITVQKDGIALPGVSVSVVEVWDGSLGSRDSEDLAQGAVYFEGGSNADGLCAGMVTLPTDVDTIDVIVHHADCRGPHTNTALRDRLGVFAPSARVTVSTADFPSLVIELEDR